MGEVSGISKNLADYLKINGRKLDNPHSNIIIFAPKLIKYLYFSKFFKTKKRKEFENLESEHYTTKEMSTIKPSGISTDFGRLESQRLPTQSGISMFGAKQEADKEGLLRMFLEMDTIEKENRSENELDDLDNISEPESDVEENQEFRSEPKQIEFTLRIPLKFEKYIRDFETLKSKKQDQLNNQSAFTEVAKRAKA